MAHVVLFHHALGRTPGVEELGRRLADAGHTVDVPDLFEGRLFDDLDAGLAYAGDVGFEAIAERGAAAAEDAPRDAVYVGVSLGVLPAQRLAQTREGCRGVVLLHACVPPAMFGGWRRGVPLQIHAAAADHLFLEDAAALDELRSVADAEVFLYDGDQHLFSDSGLPAYDAVATDELLTRLIDFVR